LQVVDLQNSEEFQALDVELLSIAPDPPEAWRDAADDYGIDEATLVLSDVENDTANAYDVMRWKAATGEPGHTFILVDERGKIAWIRDYGALEHGGIMYVAPDEIVRLVAPLVPRLGDTG
jgi:peroxiredoxin